MQFYPTPCHYSPYVQIFSLCSFIKPPVITSLMSRYSHYAVLSNPLQLLHLCPDILTMQFYPTPCHYSPYVQIFSLCSFIQPPSITSLCQDILTIRFYPTPCHYSLLFPNIFPTPSDSFPILCPFKSVRTATVLYILIIKFLDSSREEK